MMNRKELKANARESLTGKYGDAIGIILLLVFISFAMGFGVGIVKNILGLNKESYIILQSIGSLILSGLFTFGYMNFFLKISRDEEVEINELWNKTSLFIPYIMVTILISLFTFLWMLLFIIPGIIAAFSYSMSYYVMLDHPKMSPIEAIQESKRIMKGHKFDLFLLEFSFLGWAILGIFTFGILWLWLIPYMNVTTANFYNEIKELA